MAVRLREIPWASQPQEFAGIDWTHPAARGLVGAWVPTQGPGNLAITGGSRLFVPASVEASGANLAGRYSGQISSDSAVTNAAALGFAIGLRTGTAAVQSVVLSRGSGSAQFGFHASHSNSSYAGAVYSGAGFTIIGKPTGAALADNTRYDIGARIAASNGAVYSGGVKTATNASAAAPGTSGAGLYFASDSAGGNTWTADPWIEYLYIWNIAPEDWVFRDVAANPWQIFEPQRIWFPVAAAGGGVTLTVADAAHAHAADAITLASASDLAVADSAHAHTSEVPALSADTSISVQDQAHAHTDGGPLDLSGVPSLAVDAVAHGHTSEAITLSSESLLAIADALHGHTSTSVVLVLPSAAFLLTEPFKDWDGNLLALATIPGVVVLDPATRAVLLSLADQVTQVDARLRLEDSALPIGQPVVVVSFNADGSARGIDTYTVQ